MVGTPARSSFLTCSMRMNATCDRWSSARHRCEQCGCHPHLAQWLTGSGYGGVAGSSAMKASKRSFALRKYDSTSLRRIDARSPDPRTT